MRKTIFNSERRYFWRDFMLFLYIATPVFYLAYTLGFLSLVYEVSADIKTDYSGKMNTQVFYTKEGLNSQFDEQHSARQKLILKKDTFSRLSVRLTDPDRTLQSLRLDLGDEPRGTVTVRNLRVGGRATADIGDTSSFFYNDLRLISADGSGGAVFEITGGDPHIASKYAIVSADGNHAIIKSAKRRVWLHGFIALIICCALFAAARFIPAIRRACGLDWGMQTVQVNSDSRDREEKPAATDGDQDAAASEGWVRMLFLKHPAMKGIFPAALVIACLFMVLFFRSPAQLVHPEPHQEDFGIFLSQEYNIGFPGTAFKLYNGYVHILPRIIAWASMKFDLQNTMIAMNWTVLLIKILTFFLIFKSKEISSRRIKFSLLAYLVLLPFPEEIYNNVTNLQWWLILLMAAVILRRDTSRLALTSSIILLVLTGLTGVNAVLFALPCAFLLYNRRTKECLVKSLIVVICGCIQLVCLFSSPRIGKIMYNGGGYTDIIDLFANMAICRSLFNIDSPHYINIAAFVCFALAAALNLWYYRRNAAVRFVFLLAAIYLMAIFYNFLKSDFDDLQIHSPRYWYFSRICAFVLLISTLNILIKRLLNGSRDYRRIMAYCCFILCLILVKNYPVINIAGGYQYYDDIEKFQKAPTGETVSFHYFGAEHCPIKPDVWTCDWTKK